MSLSYCPLCGEKTMRNMSNPKAFEDAHPEFWSVGGACITCSRCRRLLDAPVGTRVFLRQDKVSGSLRARARNDEGFLFRVQLDDGRDMTVTASALEVAGSE